MSMTRVLIVHHDGATRYRLRGAIESLGPDFSVDDVRSGEEAFLEFMRQPVDLLVVGLSLLGMSGLELIERVRVRKKDIQIIALSNVRTRDLERKAATLGIETIVPADIEPASLVALIERLVGVTEEILIPETPQSEPEEPAPVFGEAAPPQKPVIHLDELTRPSLSMPLATLRQHVQAITVMLVNDHGRVLAQAGDFADLDSGSSLMNALVTVFGAGTKVTHLLGGGTLQNFFVLKGADQHIFLLSIDDTFALLVLLPSDAPIGQEDVHPAMLQTASALYALFSNLGLLEKEETATVPLPQTGSLDASLLAELTDSDENLAALFETAPSHLEATDADEFWSAMTEEEGAGTVSLNLPDALSYEEALRLGLVPKDEETS